MSEPAELPPTKEFDRRVADLVADFTCVRPGGEERPWEEDVRLWIIAGPGEQGALDAVELVGDKVWLWLTEESGLIGFASLGLRPGPEGEPTETQILPYLGVHGNARGKGYGQRIFRWVVEEAKRRHRDEGAPGELVLYVDPNNTGAIEMYAATGFRRIGSLDDDPRRWVVMSLALAGESLPG